MNEQRWTAEGKPVVEKTPEQWAAEATNSGQGMECPDCGCRHWYTKRTTKVAGKVKRERECRYCQHPMTTYETPAGESI